MTTTDAAQDVEESEELRRFRESWKAEVKKRKTEQTSQPAEEATAAAGKAPVSDEEAFIKAYAAQLQVQDVDDAETQKVTSGPSKQPAVQVTPPVARPAPVKSAISDKLQRAVDIYRRAVQEEQKSNLDVALMLYRQAFRIEPRVDKAYHQAEMQVIAQATPTSTGTPVASSSTSSATATATSTTLPLPVRAPEHVNPPPPPAPSEAPIAKAVATTTTSRSDLARIVANFPPSLLFESEDEREKAWINSLPDEMLVHILVDFGLDPSAVERFAAVNRKARVISLDPTIWRRFVVDTYQPPQISIGTMLEDVANDYTWDYRQMYIEHPRLRVDGVYIAVCHYVRTGLSENAWVNISHLITYHRYLRFFPDGTVLSLLANDEVEPLQVVQKLKRSYRRKGLSIGTWRLSGTVIHIDDLASLEPGGTSSTDSKYVFRMALNLRSRPLGRWNKLDWIEYASVRIEDGEAQPFVLKHERPFWFSKVKSYATSSGGLRE